MQLLCTSDSVAFILSLRIALEGEDIAIHCSDPLLNPVGALGPIAGAGGRIYVLDEKDWPRAVEIYRDLSNAQASARPEASTGGLPVSARWIAVAAAVAAILAVGILMLAER